MNIETFADVFEIERRQYTVLINPETGRRLHLSASGIPHRSLLYWVIAQACVLALIGFFFVCGVVAPFLFTPFSWFGTTDLRGYFAWLILGPVLVLLVIGGPIAAAYVITTRRVDGRTPHAWLITWLSFQRRPKRTSNGRPLPHRGSMTPVTGSLRVRWDLSAPTLQRLRIRGPIRVRFAEPVRYSLAPRGWKAKPDSNGHRGEREVQAGEILETRP